MAAGSLVDTKDPELYLKHAAYSPPETEILVIFSQHTAP